MNLNTIAKLCNSSLLTSLLVISVAVGGDRSGFPSNSSLPTELALQEVQTASHSEPILKFMLPAQASNAPERQRTPHSSSQSNLQPTNLDAATTGFTVPTVERSYAVASSPDGRLLAIADGGSIKLLNLQSNQVVQTISAFSDSRNNVSTMTFSPDSQTLLTDSENNTISAWSVNTGQRLYRLSGHSELVNSIALSPDGLTLVSSGGDVNLWNLTTKKLSRTLHKEPGWPSSVAFSPDGQTVAASLIPPEDIQTSSQLEIAFWNVTTGKQIRSIPLQSDPSQITFSPDGQIMAVALVKCTEVECYERGENVVQLWNTKTGQPIRTLSIAKHRYEPAFSFNSVAFSPDGKTIASGGGMLSFSKIAGLWEWKTGKLLRSVSAKKDSNSQNIDSINAVAFSPGGKIVVFAGGNQLQVWDLSNLQSTPKDKYQERNSVRQK